MILMATWSMFTFDESNLKEKLDCLPPYSRLAFAVSCAQRLSGVGERFIAFGGRANHGILDSALDYVWTHVLTKDEPAMTTQRLAEIMNLIPDEDAPGWTPLHAYGDDALSAVAYSLRCLQSGESQEAAWAAGRIYEAVDHFVIHRDDLSSSDSGIEKKILSDPLIQAELVRQADDLDKLRSAGDRLSPELLDTLRRNSGEHQAIIIV